MALEREEVGVGVGVAVGMGIILCPSVWEETMGAGRGVVVLGLGDVGGVRVRMRVAGEAEGTKD